MVQGTYKFRLTVWDNKYQPSSTDITVINGSAEPINKIPYTFAGKDTVLTLPADSLLLDGTTSYDPDGKIIKYQWIYVTGPAVPQLNTPANAKTTVNRLVAGTYYFKLTTWDNKYEPSQDMVMIKVNPPLPPPNQIPVVFAGKDTAISLPVNTFTLTGSAIDADGTIIKYEWKQMAGPSASVINNPNNLVTSVDNLMEGVYYFSLNVWDNKYQHAKDVVKLTVIAAMPAGNKLLTGTGENRETVIGLNSEKPVYNSINISASPNPVLSVLNLEYIHDQTGKLRISIYDFQGRIIRSYMFNKHSSYFRQQFQLNDLDTGMYMAEVMLDNKRTAVIKFYKK
jgi:hypothetical protein